MINTDPLPVFLNKQKSLIKWKQNYTQRKNDLSVMYESFLSSSFMKFPFFYWVNGFAFKFVEPYKE